MVLLGIVEGIRGIFISDDQGFSWLRINDDAPHGRGTIYGDPVRAQKGN